MKQTTTHRDNHVQRMPKWILILTIGILFMGCSEDNPGAPPRLDGPALVDRINSPEELQTLLDSADHLLLLVEFYADWCDPCRKVAPILESIAKEAPPHVKIIKVNIDDNRSIANRFKVRGVPTVVLIRDQQPADSLLGVHPKRKYLEMIRQASSG